MCVRVLSLVIFLLPRLIQGMLSKETPVFENCDQSKGITPGGRLGRVSSEFPWLGVLRPLRPTMQTMRTMAYENPLPKTEAKTKGVLDLYCGDVTQTGIPRLLATVLQQNNLLRFGKGGVMVIMVRDMFAIGVTDELMRLPKYLFKGYASIMFEYHGSRSYKMISCIPHSEYDEDAEEGTTVNAMALLQLQPIDPGDVILRGPIISVCLQKNINVQKVSEHLYAVLYSKKNLTFEKRIYSMKYMAKELCQQFYNKGGLDEEGFEPLALQCAHTRRMRHSCVWESGVALVTNATGTWNLVGLGTKSLGCSNPTRFIDLEPYIPWIEAVTTSDKWKEVLNRRFAMDHKGHLRKGFIQRPPWVGPPITADVSTALPDQHRVIQGMYPFDTDKLHEPFSIYQADPSKLHIFPIPGQHGPCTEGEIIYRDQTELVCPDDGGAMTYRLTMYDDDFTTILCTKVELEALYGDDATVYADEQMRTKTGTAFRELGDTPDEILNRVFMNPVIRRNKTSNDPKTWVPGPPMKPMFLTDKRNVIQKKTHNIYLRLYFVREAMLHITVMGERTASTTGKPSLRVQTKSGTVRRRFMGARPRNITKAPVVTLPPRRFPIEENDEVTASNATWRPVKSTTEKPKRTTRRRSYQRPNVQYELYNLAPETAMLKSAAAFTRIQLVFLFITIFATLLLYLMHFS